MISLRLEPGRHPDPRATVAAAWSPTPPAPPAAAPTCSPPMKLIFVAWFAAMALAPRPLARRLALWFLFPQRRRIANRLLGRLQRGGQRRRRRGLSMRILLVTSMVPDADGVGAIPKLLAGAAAGAARARHEVTLVTHLRRRPRPGRGGGARCSRSDLDAHILDRRRSASARRRWRVRAELAATWASEGLALAGRLRRRRRCNRCSTGWRRAREFDVVAVEDNPMAVLRFPAGVPVVLTEHEAIRAPASQLAVGAALRTPAAGAAGARLATLGCAFCRALWARFDLLQVFCEADAAEVRRRAPALAPRVRVNPYGMVLPAPCRPAPESSPAPILFTGTFAHLPNRDAARWLAARDHARGPGPRTRGAPADRRQRAARARSSSSPAPGVEVIADAPSDGALPGGGRGRGRARCAAAAGCG